MKTTAAIALTIFTACASKPPAIAPAAATPSIREYTVLISGNLAGTEVVERSGDQLKVAYEYNDRGRGPKTETLLAIGPDAIPVEEKTTGVDYYKGPVEETFASQAGRSTWKNKAESGKSDKGTFYVSMFGPPEELGVLAKALLRSPSHALPLLPAGEARIETGPSVTVAQSPGSGVTRHVTNYTISGLGFAPVDVWLDDAGNLFGAVSSWTSTIPKGWEAAAAPLVAAQTEQAKTRAARLATTLGHVPANGTLVIQHARLFDPLSRTTKEDQSIAIRGDRIASIGESASFDVPAGAETIDASGMTAVPGLWDMHVHIGEGDGVLHLASGVTSVRDLGNDVDTVHDLRQRFDNGTTIGPRMVLAGLIDGPGPFAGPTKFLAGDAETAKRMVDEYADLGYEQIKIYSSIKPELVPVMTREAHARGLRVSGHIPAFMTAADAVRNGYDEIQHINMLVLNFLPDVKDTRTPARFVEVAKRAAELDLGSKDVRDFLELLKNHPCSDPPVGNYRCQPEVVIDPTVSIFEGMFTGRPGSVSPDFAAVADRLPPQVRRGLLAGGLAVPEGMDAKYRASFAKLLEFVRTLHDDGIPIVAGTDSLPGFALHRELELYVRAGIPAPEVLRIATLGAATVTHRADRLGSIEQGKLADIYLVEGDPTKEISDIRRGVKVIRGGVVYDIGALDASIGVAPVK